MQPEYFKTTTADKLVKVAWALYQYVHDFSSSVWFTSSQIFTNLCFAESI